MQVLPVGKEGLRTVVAAVASWVTLALLIAASEYRDHDLSQLRAPGRDAAELARVLRDPRIRGYEVEVELNTPIAQIQERILDFCADRHPDDQLLIYLSCHGVLDSYGRLHYATTDTKRRKLAAAAVAAVWLNERLDECRARCQVLILDCCHSGAFARGAKGDTELALQRRFEPRGRGWVVLTASRGTDLRTTLESPRPRVRLSGQGRAGGFPRNRRRPGTADARGAHTSRAPGQGR
jgi:hypothetical protein